MANRNRYYVLPEKAIRGNLIDDMQADHKAIFMAFEGVQDEEKMMDAGGAGVDYIHFLFQPNSGDRFMVDDMVYKFFSFSPFPPPRPPWRPPWEPRPINQIQMLGEPEPMSFPDPDVYDVGILIGGDVEQTIDRAAAAIENNIYTGVRGVRALNGMGPVLLLAARWAGSDSNFPVAEETGGVRMVVGNERAMMAKNPVQRKIITANYYMNDTDVAALAAGCEIPLACCIAETPPTFGGATVVRGPDLNMVPLTEDVGWGVRQVGNEMWIVTIHDVGGIIASGDQILVTAWT